MKITLPQTRCVGRYKIVTPRGETPWSDNVFTLYGIAFFLHAGANALSAAVSTSSAPATEAGELATYRASSTLVSSSVTRSISPDANGNLFWRARYRFTFPANGSYGKVTLKKGVMIVSSGVPIFNGILFGNASESALIGADGGEGSVEVDMATEDIDLIWEFTEYVPAESSGTVRGWKAKADGVPFDVVDYAYTIRPANFSNTADSSKGWAAISGNAFPSMAASPVLKCGLGTLGGADQAPTFTESFTADSASQGVAMFGAKQNTITAQWGFDKTTSTKQVNLLSAFLGHMEWQVSFDPPIPKKAIHLLDLSLTVGVSNT